MRVCAAKIQSLTNINSDSSTEKQDKDRANENRMRYKELSNRIYWASFVRMHLVMYIKVVILAFQKAHSVAPFLAKNSVVAYGRNFQAISKISSREMKIVNGSIAKKIGSSACTILFQRYDVSALLNIAERGLALGGSRGGASILDLHSGALSKDDAFINIYKVDGVNKVFTKEDFKIYSHIKNKIHGAISKHFGVKKSHLYLTYPTFFSRMTSAPPQTIHDEYWHAHVDKETYKSFHYTSLLYLSDYKHHFDGGRFIFIDKDANKTVEPRAGRVSAFTSGSENLHHVEKVTRGTRFAITISFTCDPKHAIKDPIIVQVM
ncbi:unnamed protein product, partial [Meganyctiphanes norvegica]